MVPQAPGLKQLRESILVLVLKLFAFEIIQKTKEAKSQIFLSVSLNKNIRL